MGPRPWALLLLPLLLWSPSAHAATVAGTAELTGPLHLPAAQLEARPLAAYLNDTSTLSTLEASTPLLRVTRTDWRLISLSAGPTPARYALQAETSTYTLHNASFSLAQGDHGGWLGLYPQPLSTLALDTSAPLTLQPAAASRLGNSPSHDETSPEAGLPLYSRTVAAPHLLFNASGSWRASGAYALKLLGPDLEIRSDENTTTHRTARADRTEPLTDSHETWLLLEWTTGTLTLTTPAPLQVAASRATAAWTGTAELTATAHLQTGTQTYEAAQPRAYALTGTLTAHLEPQTGSTALLRLSGDLTAATLPAQPLSLLERAHAPHVAIPALLSALLLALACAALGAGYAHARRRNARHQAELERALAASLRPDDLSRTHDAPSAARLIISLLTLNRHDDRAATALREALTQTPALALEAADDPEIQALLHRRPDLAGLLHTARTRADERLQP